MKRSCFLIFILTIFLFKVEAFSCQEIVGQTYLSPGDSDFQYQYQFLKGNKVKLAVYMLSHDDESKGKHQEVKIDKFEGIYRLDKDTFSIWIKVDNVKHKITFSCLDKEQYMSVGPYSKTLKVKVTEPLNHGFSMIDLWPKKSAVIRRDFSKK